MTRSIFSVKLLPSAAQIAASKPFALAHAVMVFVACGWRSIALALCLLQSATVKPTPVVVGMFSRSRQILNRSIEIVENTEG